MPLHHEPAKGYTYHGVTIPAAVAEELDAWIATGETPGSFLQAVLCNDLRESMGRASVTNRLALHALVIYLYNEAPGPCWGSPEKVRAWALARAKADLAAAGQRADITLGAVFGERLDATTDNHDADAENSLESPEAGLLSNLPHDA